MRFLKIKTFIAGNEKPKSVLSIPLAVARLAGRLIPRPVAEDLARKGINVPEILAVITKEGLQGTLIEIERSGERTVVSVE